MQFHARLNERIVSASLKRNESNTATGAGTLPLLLGREERENPRRSRGACSGFIIKSAALQARSHPSISFVRRGATGLTNHGNLGFFQPNPLAHNNIGSKPRSRCANRAF